MIDQAVGVKKSSKTKLRILEIDTECGIFEILYIILKIIHLLGSHLVTIRIDVNERNSATRSPPTLITDLGIVDLKEVPTSQFRPKIVVGRYRRNVDSVRIDLNLFLEHINSHVLIGQIECATVGIVINFNKTSVRCPRRHLTIDRMDQRISNQ